MKERDFDRLITRIADGKEPMTDAQRATTGFAERVEFARWGRRWADTIKDSIIWDGTRADWWRRNASDKPTDFKALLEYCNYQLVT
jgi:hypothetical protein